MFKYKIYNPLIYLKNLTSHMPTAKFPYFSEHVFYTHTNIKAD
jgi:hypothetical protein